MIAKIIQANRYTVYRGLDSRVSLFQNKYYMYLAVILKKIEILNEKNIH